jgi:FixJ family two-component response regulator
MDILEGGGEKMRGPNPKYPISLTTEQEQKLRQLVNSPKAAQGQVLRARIILSAHDQPGQSNQQIAQSVGCSDRTVRKWRKRWVESHSITDLPRSGAPWRFSP